MKLSILLSTIWGDTLSTQQKIHKNLKKLFAAVRRNRPTEDRITTFLHPNYDSDDQKGKDAARLVVSDLQAAGVAKELYNRSEHYAVQIRSSHSVEPRFMVSAATMADLVTLSLGRIEASRAISPAQQLLLKEDITRALREALADKNISVPHDAFDAFLGRHALVEAFSATSQIDRPMVRIWNSGERPLRGFKAEPQ